MPKSRSKRRPEPFDYHAALTRADSILSVPPARAFIERPRRLPTLVFRVAIEASLCLEANKLATGRMQRNPWILGAIKDEIWFALGQQSVRWLRYRCYWPFVELDGVRPQVIATKFSARPPDVGANPAKAAIDMLQKATREDQKHRLGVILRDSPDCVQQFHGWEFQHQCEQPFVLIEVRV